MENDQMMSPGGKVTAEPLASATVLEIAEYS